MAGWIIGGLALALVVLFAVLRRLRAQHDREVTLMNRMRSSPLYIRLYPTLEQCRKLGVETVVIRPEEVRIILYRPQKRTIRFIFSEYGFDPVDQPAALLALSHAIAADVECLSDPKQYFASTHTEPRDAGGSFRWYQYQIQPDFKDYMQRAWYDHREPDEGIIR